jgi:hypothetical protein
MEMIEVVQKIIANAHERLIPGEAQGADPAHTIDLAQFRRVTKKANPSSVQAARAPLNIRRNIHKRSRFRSQDDFRIRIPAAKLDQSYDEDPTDRHMVEPVIGGAKTMRNQNSQSFRF